MHMCFPFQKKLHLDYFLFALHFLHLIPCKSLWDLTSLVSWGDKCFLCDELGYTDLLFLVQPNPFGTTEAYHSVPPISQQEKQFATYSVFILIQLHSMNLVLYKHHIFIIALCCDSRIKPIHDKFQRERERLHLYQALLGNWCQRGRERSHQSLSFRERDHISEGEREDPSRGERDLQGERILVESISQGSQMLGVQEERCHMSSWGESHVHMCLFALVCISSVHLYLSALIFCSLSSPSIPC